jgi:hypothetical protein
VQAWQNGEELRANSREKVFRPTTRRLDGAFSEQARNEVLGIDRHGYPKTHLGDTDALKKQAEMK